MKERKLTLTIRAARPGVPAEQVEITNSFPDEEALERFSAMVPVVMKMAETYMANERPIKWPKALWVEDPNSPKKLIEWLCQQEGKLQLSNPTQPKMNKANNHE